MEALGMSAVSATSRLLEAATGLGTAVLELATFNHCFDATVTLAPPHPDWMLGGVGLGWTLLEDREHVDLHASEVFALH